MLDEWSEYHFFHTESSSSSDLGLELCGRYVYLLAFISGNRGLRVRKVPSNFVRLLQNVYLTFYKNSYSLLHLVDYQISQGFHGILISGWFLLLVKGLLCTFQKVVQKHVHLWSP